MVDSNPSAERLFRVSNTELYTLFAETLSASRLETWVSRLDVEAEYDRLRHP